MIEKSNVLNVMLYLKTTIYSNNQAPKMYKRITSAESGCRKVFFV